MRDDDLRHLLSRFAIAAVFLTFGVWEIAQPVYWSVYVPKQLTSFANADLLVRVHGLALVVIGAAIALGIFLRLSAVLGTLIMLEIVGLLILESGFTDLLVRDLAILVFVASLTFDRTRYLALTK